MKHCYCINPSCQQPDHPDNNNAQTKYCVSCGSTLLLNNKYRVSRLLSDNSGFGVIYEAFDGFNGKILKVLQEKWNNEPKAVELFKREYEMLLSFGGVLLLLAAYPSYIFWRYGFSATNPLLLDRDSNEFIYKTFTGHSNPVSSIAYSPDGKYLAGGNDDGTINI